MDNHDKYTEERARQFAERLRNMRERKGLTQARLGARAGLSPAAISQLETCERKPNFATLVSLSRALSTSPNALMGVTGEDAEEPELQMLFRNLEGLSSDDVSAVEGFVEYLKSKKGP